MLTWLVQLNYHNEFTFSLCLASTFTTFLFADPVLSKLFLLLLFWFLLSHLCVLFLADWKSKQQSSICSYLTAWCKTEERWKYPRTAIHCSPFFLFSPVLESTIKSYFSIYLESLSYRVHVSTSKVWWSGSNSYWDLNFHSFLCLLVSCSLIRFPIWILPHDSNYSDILLGWSSSLPSLDHSAVPESLIT